MAERSVDHAVWTEAVLGRDVQSGLLKPCTQEVRPHHQAEDNLPPDQVNEAYGEQPAGQTRGLLRSLRRHLHLPRASASHGVRLTCSPPNLSM
jgi:hypothetical protein